MSTQRTVTVLGLVFTAMQVLALPTRAAVVDGLEDIGPDCTPVVTRVIGGVTVTISTAQGLPMTARTYFDGSCLAFTGHMGDNAPLNPNQVSGMRFISSVTSESAFPDAQPIIFQLDAPVTAFGLTTVDLLEGGGTCNPGGAHLALQGYDAAGTLVDEHARIGAQGPSGLDVDWLVSGDGIVTVKLTGGAFGDCNGYGIDDLVLGALDSDNDGIFDVKDVCPDVPAPGGVDAEGRPLGDLDCDCDVDLDDFTILQQNFTGPH